MKPPIFILCYSRSGSTLLRYIFDTHTDICSPSEMHLGNLCIHLTRAYEKTIENFGKNFESAIKLCHNNISGIMNDYCVRHNASIWCEKSVTTIDSIDWIQKVFPEARFVILHRQCLDVVKSSLDALQKYGEQGQQGFGWANNMQKYNGNNTAGLASYWEEKTTQLLEFETKNPSQCFRIKYEDIVQQPNDTLKKLFHSLDINWQEDLINRVFSASHDNGPGDDNILHQNSLHTKSIDTGKHIDTNEIPYELMLRLNNLHEHLNYPSFQHG